ncbi:tRNA intron endonuclease [Melanogaster broomeanus]|nr:tRNA intron endonuclease [Melanogaster broomeanus]
MQAHPSHPQLTQLLSAYPKSAGAFFQTYNDVTLAQKWSNIEVIDLPECQRGAIKGLRSSLTAGEPPSTCVVVPCSLAESLSTSWIRDAFARLGADAPDAIFVAICAEDSSIVYYKISKGIVKPQI